MQDSASSFSQTLWFEDCSYPILKGLFRFLGSISVQGGCKVNDLYFQGHKNVRSFISLLDLELAPCSQAQGPQQTLLQFFKVF